MGRQKNFPQKSKFFEINSLKKFDEFFHVLPIDKPLNRKCEGVKLFWQNARS